MSQNKRYHKKSHLGPRPASKFFFYFLPLAYFVHSFIILRIQLMIMRHHFSSNLTFFEIEILVDL